MVLRHSAFFRAYYSARKVAFRSFLYRFLRVGWSAAVVTVGAFTALGMTSALVGGAPFDGVSHDAYRLGAFIRLQAQGNGEIYLREGWGTSDEAGRWMSGSAALVEIPAKGLPAEDIILFVQARGNPELGKSDVFLDVLANGVAAGRMKISSMNKGAQASWLSIPAQVLSRHNGSLILCLLASPDAPRGGADAPAPLMIDELRIAAAS